MERAARRAMSDLSRGLTLLACIASTAFSIGMLGALHALLYPHLGCYGGSATFWTVAAVWYGDPLPLVACGLLVALVSLAAHRHLSGRLEDLEAELAYTSAEVLDWLADASPRSNSVYRQSPHERPGQRFPALRLRSPAGHEAVPMPRSLQLGVSYELLLLWLLMATLVGLWTLQPSPEMTGVHVNLPGTAHPVLLEQSPTQLTISIKADGQRFIGRTWVPESEFDSALQKVHARTPGRLVRIKVDRFLPYRTVLGALRAARAAGFTRLSLVTEKRAAGPR